ncbi:MAG: aspartate/glutamate racemase family protein [Rickettsiales bacterium]|nr:aspartate/glutamate racemase family protein [Rickettsiales bacterium]
MKPTIGIIGGCGPLATLDIESKILEATKKLINPIIDQDYFNLLVFNYTQFSDRNDTIIFTQKSLLDQYLFCVKSLVKIGVDILLIACQTAHVYLPELKKNTNILIVDIVEETIRYINAISPSIVRVGLLSTEATQKCKLYQDKLISYDIEVVTIPASIQKAIMQAIYIIKTGISLIDGEMQLTNHCYNKIDKERFCSLKKHPYKKILTKKSVPNPIITIIEAINYLARNGCTYVILGCTELPLILPYINTQKLNAKLIDPNNIVAESIVGLAYRLYKEKLEL